MAATNQSTRLCVVCGVKAEFDVYQAFARLAPGGEEFQHRPGDEFGHRYYCPRHMPAIFSKSLSRSASHAA